MKHAVMTLACTLALGAALIQPNTVTAQAAAPSAQENLAKSVEEIRTETLATRGQLQTSIGALTALTNQKEGDLKPAYDAFVAEVGKTHAVAAQTAKRAADMQTASKDYFGAWQQEIAGINNESLRRTAQKRLDSARRNYDKAIASLQEAANRFKPLLTELDDVQKMLAMDVTAAGVKSVRGVANDARRDGDRVRATITDALSNLQDLGVALSTTKSN
ncbi:MAG TPA: DUF2959 family protein [Verrucomicrobiae bacterium]|nr:DUF2959 family protein [Verrucomicrobiae bacterium]